MNKGATSIMSDHVRVLPTILVRGKQHGVICRDTIKWMKTGEAAAGANIESTP